ncbi:hypothetical protein AG0111_0g6512 [Alternaria gaisen]|uniref:Uncharacterized protein n=1 Tax=Alternaria gaisen TaxID=167740 RepID=A0ACB6FLM1_9PLEO|nr:hypothetical protein AG0111_0g6512 [Alternaria gaisen]
MAAAFTTSYTSSASTTSIAGPLMTAFTPPDHCNNVVKSSCVLSTPYSYTSIGTSLSYSYGDPVTSCAYVERDLSCGSDGQATRDSACFPDNNGGGSGTLLFSPGTGCPGQWEMKSEVILSSKTTAVCCPSGYEEHTDYASCTSVISYTDGTAPAVSCSSGGNTVFDLLTYSTYTSAYDASSTSIYTSIYSTYRIVWAQRILVAYPTTSASDGRVTPLGEPTSTNNPEGGSAVPIPKPDDESGLGAGAIAGIVVGVVGALLLVGAFFFWRRRQQKHHHAPIPKSSPTGEHDALPEFVATSGTSTGPAQMTAANSNGLFQPQPELRSPR